MKHRLITLCLVVMLLAGWSGSAAMAQEQNLTDGCVETFDPDTDYFPDKVEIAYAEGFSVEYFNNYKVVTILTPWQDATEIFQYVLVQCGTPVPEDYGDALIVEVPVASIVTMSTSFLPHLEEQGLLDRLVGVDSAAFVNSPDVLEKAASGELVEVGGGGMGEMNVELLIDLEPGLVMLQQFSAAGSGSRTALLEVGLKAVLNADFVDTSPLGQAEWGKYIALFFNTEALAEAYFEEVATRYENLKELAANAEEKPTVFASSPFDATWYMPGGKSYVAQLLADAGADYLWADDESFGSLFLDFETVYERAADAEFWVNVNQFWADAQAALADDERYADFAAFQSGHMYNNNARSNPNGGSDYFESGVANPDVILADLITIFHPDLLPDHELVYYQPLAFNE